MTSKDDNNASTSATPPGNKENFDKAIDDKTTESVKKDDDKKKTHTRAMSEGSKDSLLDLSTSRHRSRRREQRQRHRSPFRSRSLVRNNSLTPRSRSRSSVRNEETKSVDTCDETKSIDTKSIDTKSTALDAKSIDTKSTARSETKSVETPERSCSLVRPEPKSAPTRSRSLVRREPKPSEPAPTRSRSLVRSGPRTTTETRSPPLVPHERRTVDVTTKSPPLVNIESRATDSTPSKTPPLLPTLRCQPKSATDSPPRSPPLVRREVKPDEHNATRPPPPLVDRNVPKPAETPRSPPLRSEPMPVETPPKSPVLPESPSNTPGRSRSLVRSEPYSPVTTSRSRSLVRAEVIATDPSLSRSRSLRRNRRMSDIARSRSRSIRRDAPASPQPTAKASSSPQEEPKAVVRNKQGGPPIPPSPQQPPKKGRKSPVPTSSSRGASAKKEPEKRTHPKDVPSVKPEKKVSAKPAAHRTVAPQPKKDEHLCATVQDDPRGADPTARITQKAATRGSGRNTESFDPASTLVRPDLRIHVGSNSMVKFDKTLKHDDVVMVPELFGKEGDWSIYYKLIQEMTELQKNNKDSEWISWHEGAHLVTKDPSGSKTFQYVINRLCVYFGIAKKSVSTRFNWYRDSSDWKPFHHDSAAFNANRAKTQNITVGVSFGATRELAFVRASQKESDNKNPVRIYFPQTNNSVFTFGRDANILWKHGVNALPPNEQDGKGRISIVLWGYTQNVVEEEGSPALLGWDGQGLHAKQQHRSNSNKEGYRPRRHRREKANAQNRK